MARSRAASATNKNRQTTSGGGGQEFLLSTDLTTRFVAPFQKEASFFFQAEFTHTNRTVGISTAARHQELTGQSKGVCEHFHKRVSV